MEIDREIAKIKKFNDKLENLLGSDDYTKFKAAFKEYKNNALQTIDSFCTQLFEAFFGSQDVVCHLEVVNYVTRKQILIQLCDQVQQRHRDMFVTLTTTHFQACENKPRTKPVGENQPESDDRLCIVCYKSENLYAAKC